MYVTNPCGTLGAIYDSGRGGDVHSQILGAVQDIVGERVTLQAVKSPSGRHGASELVMYWREPGLPFNLSWTPAGVGLPIDYSVRAVQVTGHYQDPYTFIVETYGFIPCSSPLTDPVGGAGSIDARAVGDILYGNGDNPAGQTSDGRTIYWSRCLEPGEPFELIDPGGGSQPITASGRFNGLLWMNQAGQVFFNRDENNPLHTTIGAWIVENGRGAIAAAMGQPGRWWGWIEGTSYQPAWTTDPNHQVVDVTAFGLEEFQPSSSQPTDPNRPDPILTVDPPLVEDPSPSPTTPGIPMDPIDPSEDPWAPKQNGKKPDPGDKGSGGGGGGGIPTTVEPFPGGGPTPHPGPGPGPGPGGPDAPGPTSLMDETGLLIAAGALVFLFATRDRKRR